jgi:hypothetical protein
MSAKKFFYAMVGLVVLLSLLIAASVFGANLFLNKQKDKLVNAKIENRVVEEQQSYLIQAKKDLEKYDELSEIARAIVPQDKDQAKTVREISAIAEQSGIHLDAVTFPISSLGGTAAAPSTSGSDTSTSGTGSTTPSGLTQVVPVEGIPGVYSLEVIVTSQSAVPYYQFLNFLERLESNRRTAHVQKLILTPTESGDGLSFILTLNAYVKP